MYEDAASFVAGGLKVYWYGLHLAIGALLAGCLLWLRARHDLTRRNAAALTMAAAPVLGLMFARLLYTLADPSFAEVRSTQTILDLSTGGYAMFGALLGVVLSALLAARGARLCPAGWLDEVAPALLVFVAAARLGEGYTALGISRPLVTGFFKNTFLAYQDEYDTYLRTYLLEAAAALLLALALLALLKKRPAPGRVALTGALAFGVTQTLFESLRYDGHLRFGFIGLQHVLAAALFTAVIIALGLRLLKNGRHKGLAVGGLTSLPVVWAALIGVEFMIDRSSMSKWLSYLLYMALLAVPALLGLTMIKKVYAHGQAKD